MSRTVVTNPPKKPSSNEDDNDLDYDEFCANTTLTTSFREDPFICNKYIRCNHGYAQKFKCSKDTAWDISTKQCLWVHYVECGSRQYVSDEQVLGENDSDESMKHNATRTTRTTRTTTTKSTTLSTIKSTLSKSSLSKEF